jgi:hypothetical protein
VILAGRTFEFLPFMEHRGDQGNFSEKFVANLFPNCERQKKVDFFLSTLVKKAFKNHFKNILNRKLKKGIFSGLFPP